MFGLFKKEDYSEVKCEKNELIAMADGKRIDVKSIDDPVFAEEMMGQTMAFQFEEDTVTLCAPCSGVLSVMYPTGHAFGITMENGAQILVHVGIETVNANGDGFKVYHKQDDTVKAGMPIVKVNLRKLSKKYDMSTMLIVTDANEKNVSFSLDSSFSKGSIIGKIG